jgi:outer membrane protein TolC
MALFRCFIGIGMAVYMVWADTLSLEKAQKILFDNSIDMVIEKKNIAIAEQSLRIVKASLQPVVSAYGMVGLNSEIPELSIDLSSINPMLSGTNKISVGDHDREEFGIDVLYPFFTGLVRYNAIKSARERISAEKEVEAALKNSLSFQLGILYFTWELSCKTIDVRKLYLKQVQDYAILIQNLKEGGVATQTNLLQAQASVAMAEVDCMAAENRNDSLRRELVNLIRSPETDIVPAEYWKYTDTATDIIIPDLTISSQRPETRLLEKNSQQLFYNQKVLFGQRLPSLGGTAGYRVGKPGINMGSSDFMQYWLLGVRLDWNIWDGQKLKTQQKQIAGQIDILSLRKEKLINDFTKQIQFAKNQLIQARTEITAALRARQAASLVVQDMQNRLAAGTTTSIEYLSALNNQALTQLNEAVAQFKVKAASCACLYAAGREIVY